MMNNHASRNELKVDSTFLKLEQDSVVVVYNINIPEHYLHDQAELIRVLERIQFVITRDFGILSVLYQISASYILKQSNTGQNKTWTGSFFARNNTPGLIADFQQFNPATFVRQSLNQLINIEPKLRWNGVDTKWNFDQLLSIIFNVQCKVSSRNPIVTNKRHREHRTFSL